MKLHEHQGKELLRKYGVSVPAGHVAFKLEEANKAIDAMTSKVIVVKAQIHAGGRGKGGGVKVAKTKGDAKQYAKDILGMNLVTHQTGPEGKQVSRLLLEEGCNIARELYIGITLDRASSHLTLIASTEGGMEIEEVAEKHPEKMIKESIDPNTGFTAEQGLRVAKALQLENEAQSSFTDFVQALYLAYLETDASLVEINPLVVTGENKLMALDAKITVDDNALFRHPELEAYRDLTEEEPSEIEANKFGLSYIKLDGNIGCMVNGAGLAMATMDIIKYYGGEPANFLDVGGSATKETVTEAFKIILKDKNVKGILVNIFAGIMKCDIIAEGVIAAAKELDVKVPLVVRLQGTNVEKGRDILSKSGLNIVPAEGLAEAAQKIVKSLAH
ncbi:MAG: ADP-forming succinate--CoA ligase subunit beta [Deltaproteobacteria bacterium CG11_big_fil_rev_8_21_14_0_20_42_23]|nr:MAG: ADP-forming succinate--CoA ligase subunit beta [Deltaproteobacteria bacterium CG11_big_fil_rev_8_21_14_0_20_42_23]PJC64996.1 MAG: ADP-forming succinate--CoA ligase subunit beta [Deltaproteobacteria bacterium CG_4_9_14_0_2_um_filter_42_21]